MNRFYSKCKHNQDPASLEFYLIKCLGNIKFIIKCYRVLKARGRSIIKMAEETSKKRSKEEQNVEDESEDEMIGPLPVQPSKPKKKKGILLFLQF